MREFLFFGLAFLALMPASQANDGSCLEFDGQALTRPKANCEFQINSHAVKLNEYGIRGYAKAGPKNVYKVLLLGAGVVLSPGTELANSLGAKIETQLAKKLKRPVQVINAAVLGYTPVQYAFFLPKLLEAYKPQMVLYMLNSGSILYENALLFQSLEKNDSGEWLSIGLGNMKKRTMLAKIPFLSGEAKQKLANSLDLRRSQLKIMDAAFNRKKGGNPSAAMLRPLSESLLQLRRQALASNSEFYAIWPGGAIHAESKYREYFGYDWFATLSKPFEGSFNLNAESVISFFEKGNFSFLLQVDEIFALASEKEGASGPFSFNTRSSETMASAIISSMDRAGVFKVKGKKL